MARGAGVLPVKKKSAGVKQSSDKNSDITVYAEENFSGNSQTFEISNKDFKTNFDVNFKEPVKSIIISGFTSWYSKSKSIFYFKAIPGSFTLNLAMLVVQHSWKRESKNTNKTFFSSQ